MGFKFRKLTFHAGVTLADSNSANTKNINVTTLNKHHQIKAH